MVQGEEGEVRGPLATLPTAPPASLGRSGGEAEAGDAFLGSEGLLGRSHSWGNGRSWGRLRPLPSQRPHFTGGETEAGDGTGPRVS